MKFRDLSPTLTASAVLLLSFLLLPGYPLVYWPVAALLVLGNGVLVVAGARAERTTAEDDAWERAKTPRKYKGYRRVR